ncbi:camphor resistance protein CrcB [Actinocorallia herbida]|uniref:Fluoride-specific ion channel FluC n=1 Tax=Actinocorallia herbida TaxID=58109 RepID=A0A3N1D4Z1_9ACTN|nr:CrcB family protein [Actinocorallia herbida]ROO88148.1 camphor resistance protein CrcB [Actinocorallia herbida]
MTLLLVALGGSLGALLRYLTDRLIHYRYAPAFPWATFTVNVTGSALLGLLLALSPNDGVMSFAATGVCGALTTYSTFSYDTYRLATADRLPLRATTYTLTTITAGLLAALAAHHLASPL